MKTKYSATDLIELYFEFYALVPDEKNWVESKLKLSPPIYFRYKQIESLCYAYGIDSFRAFIDGDFTDNSIDLSDFNNRMLFITIIENNGKKMKIFNGDDMIGIREYYLSIYNTSIKAKKDNVYRVSRMISPKNKTYKKSELVSKFGFPDVDIKELDIKHAPF